MKRSLTLVTLVAAHVLVVAHAAHAGIPTTPVPEPSTLMLLGAGAGVVGIGAWWRSRKK